MLKKALVLFSFFLIISVFWHFYQNDIFNKTIVFFSDYFEKKNQTETIIASETNILENINSPVEASLGVSVENPDPIFDEEKPEEVRQDLSQDKEEVAESKSESFIWLSTTYRNGKVIKPKKEGVFSVLFDEKTFTTTTDCNQIGGEYSFFQNRIVFNNIHSTKKLCQNSDENEFKKILEGAGTFYFTDLGELVIVFKGEEASALFK